MLPLSSDMTGRSLAKNIVLTGAGLLAAIALLKPDYEPVVPAHNDFMQRSIIGQSINDAFASNASGLTGCINEYPQVDYEAHLASRWDAKINRHTNLHPDVPELSQRVQQRFRDGPKTKMSLEDRLIDVQNTLDVAPINWDHLRQTKMFSPRPNTDKQSLELFQKPRMELLKNISQELDASYFMAITMTEFFASHDGHANATLLDHMFKDAGVEYVLSLPANDQHRSYSGQQITWSSVTETNRVHKTQYDIMDISGNQDIEVSHLHSLTKFADILRDLPDNQLKDFERLLSDKKNLSAITGGLHYKPVFTKNAVMYSLQENTSLTDGFRQVGDRRLQQYVQKMRTNIDAINNPQENKSFMLEDFVKVGTNSQGKLVYRVLTTPQDTACEITTALDRLVDERVQLNQLFNRQGFPVSSVNQDTLYVLAEPLEYSSNASFTSTQE